MLEKESDVRYWIQWNLSIEAISTTWSMCSTIVSFPTSNNCPRSQVKKTMQHYFMTIQQILSSWKIRCAFGQWCLSSESGCRNCLSAISWWFFFICCLQDSKIFSRSSKTVLGWSTIVAWNVKPFTYILNHHQFIKQFEGEWNLGHAYAILVSSFSFVQ